MISNKKLKQECKKVTLKKLRKNHNKLRKNKQNYQEGHLKL